jgi:hypothetical protein
MVMGLATDGSEVVQAEEGSSLSYLLLKSPHLHLSIGVNLHLKNGALCLESH